MCTSVGVTPTSVAAGFSAAPAEVAWAMVAARECEHHADDDTSLHHELRFPLGPKAFSEYV